MKNIKKIGFGLVEETTKFYGYGIKTLNNFNNKVKKFTLINLEKKFNNKINSFVAYSRFFSSF